METTPSVSVNNTKVIRKLGGREEWYIQFQKYCKTSKLYPVLRVTGPVTEELVLNALKLVQQRHPSLRLFVRKVPQDECKELEPEYMFVEPEHPEQYIRLEVNNRKISDEVSTQYWEDLINSDPQDDTQDDQLLWRVILTLNSENPNGPHEIIIVISHGICDGVSIVTLSGDIFYFLNNPTADPEPFKMHPTAESLFLNDDKYHELLKVHRPENGDYQKVLDNFMNNFNSFFVTQKNIPFEERRSVPVPVIIRKDIMERVAQKCRQHKTSMTPLMCALAVNCLQKVFGLNEQKVIDLAIPINIRKYCTPEIPNSQLGALFSTKSTKCASDKNIWRNAQELDKKFRQDLKLEAMKNVSVLPLIIELVKRQKDAFLGTGNYPSNEELCVSNVGSHQFFKGGPIAFDSLYSFQNLNGYGGIFTYPIVLSCGTINGDLNLSINCFYPRISREQMKQFAEMFHNEMRSIAYSVNSNL